MAYDESAKQYELAIEVLSLRIKNIKDRMAKEEEQDKGKGKASGDDPYVKDKKELSELEELLPEVKEKVSVTCKKYIWYNMCSKQCAGR